MISAVHESKTRSVPVAGSTEEVAPPQVSAQVSPDLPAAQSLAALARIGGLPVEHLHQLHNHRSLAWADAVIDAEAVVAHSADTFSELLHDLIGDNTDQEQRRALLNLRRKVFKAAPITDPTPHRELLENLDPRAASVFGEWAAAMRRLSALHEQGDTTVAEEMATSRSMLRAAAAHPALHRGLQIASPPLAQQLPGYLAASGSKTVDKKQRKFERSILSYLSRAAVKPSPFGSFTPVQAVCTTADGENHSAVGLPSTSRSNVRLNVAVLARITRCLVENPQTRNHLPIEATAGWQQVEDRIRYVRRWMSQGDEGQAVTFDSVTDKVFFLRTTETIDELLGALEGGRHTFGEMCDWIGRRHDASPQLCAQYLSTLIEIGLVDIPVLQVPVHAPDPLQSLAGSLTDVDTPWSAALALRLDDVGRVVEQIADEHHRVQALHRLPVMLREIFAELDAEPALPQTLVYEDDVLAGGPLQVQADTWDEQLVQPLQALDPLVSAFDITLPQRLTLTAFFVARFGAGGECDDVLRLLHEFQEDFFDQYQTISGQRTSHIDGEYQPEVNWLRSQAISALDEARREFDLAVGRLYEGHQDAEEIVVGADVVEAVGKHTAGFIDADEPRSYLVQSATIGKQRRVVLNQLYGGLHFPFSRFAYALPDVETAGFDAILRARAVSSLSTDQVYAEVTGGLVTSNLNLHPELTSYEIVCPGERSSRPLDQQIDFDDLYAVHDVARDRVTLRSRRLGKEVVPAYLGYLIPLALPEIPRSLLLFAHTAMMQLDPWAGQASAQITDGVGYRPRVRVGEVVLTRRAWRVAGSDLPLDTCGDSDRMLTWRRWQRAHGLPERVFAKVSRTSGFRGAGTSKPMYVDFASGLTLQALEGALDVDALVTFTECLPDPADAPGHSESGSHAIEYAIEVLPEPRSS